MKMKTTESKPASAGPCRPAKAKLREGSSFVPSPKSIGMSPDKVVLKSPKPYQAPTKAPQKGPRK